MGTELTKQDRCDWNLQKAICKRHLIPLMETAQALKAIRDRKLWRVEHDSFEAFIDSLYGRSLRWANSLIVKQIGPATHASAVIGSETAKNSPDATENADSAPDATENAVSEPPAEPPKSPPKPPDPFKKLDDLIGKAIRATDDIGEGPNHDAVFSLLSQLLKEIVQWKRRWA